MSFSRGDGAWVDRVERMAAVTASSGAVPAALAAGNTLTLSAVARDLSGMSATATAQARTTGPGGISGYVFDDTTGYVLEGALASIAGETTATSDAAGERRSFAHQGPGQPKRGVSRAAPGGRQVSH